MLTTDTYTIAESIEELDEQIDTLDEALDELDSDTDRYKGTKARKDKLTYYRRGLRWQRDEEGWDPDTEIELGAMTAAEEALMHRQMTTGAEDKERRLWFAAASTVDAPYHSDDLSETFANLGQCSPAFVDWVEAKSNTLGVPGTAGNSSEGEPNSTS